MTKDEAVVGALIKHPDYDRHGVIVHADETHIRVEYDDGHIGLLYWDRTMLPCAFSFEVAAQEPEPQ